MNWILGEDGYHRERHYVDGSGRICAVVRGSEFEEREGWHARITEPGKDIPLGRFVTEEHAMDAVVRHFMGN